jgi:hypothetical protein
MPGSYPVLQLGPATYTVSAAVTGGQLVMVDGSTGKVKPTTGAAVACLGMATSDASPAGSGTNLNYATPRSEVSVVYGPAEVVLTAAGTIAFGALVVAAANGQVVTVGAGTFDQVVGRCTEPAGIASGATGRVRLA